jgi:glycosyltransferase involved in cell wall biosynthesis
MYAAEFGWLTSRAALTLDRVTWPLATRLIAVSNGVRDDLLQHGATAAQIEVISNPFDPSRSTPSDRATARTRLGVGDGDVVVGTVALLKEQKGIRDLVQAAAIVASRHPGVTFVHVGGGPLEAEARQWIADAGLERRFLLVGWVADPLSLLPGMDVFALPSLWEGLPIALLEAMAAGLPAVGTRVAGIEEVILDGVTGRLVPSKNPAALADALIDLLSSPEKRGAMGAAGRSRLSEFDARPIALKTRDLYQEVLARTVRRS